MRSLTLTHMQAGTDATTVSCFERLIKQEQAHFTAAFVSSHHHRHVERVAQRDKRH